MKQKIIPVLSVLVGIAAFVLTSQYLRRKQMEIEEERARLYEGARTIAVVAAARDIPSQTVIRRSDLGKMDIYEAKAPDRIITLDQASLILGRKTQFEINARKPILWSDIEGGSPSDMGLASIVTPGMRAISLAAIRSGGPSSKTTPSLSIYARSQTPKVSRTL